MRDTGQGSEELSWRGISKCYAGDGVREEEEVTAEGLLLRRG